MKNRFFLLTLIFAVALFSLAARAQIASGGVYTLEQAVIASGGNASGGGNYLLEGTSGQSAAGVLMTGTNYDQIGGFWTAPPLAPTSANVTVGGRVLAGKAAPVRGAIVTLTGGTLTAPLIAVTNNFGNFTFTDVEIGHFYIVSVQHKKYGFAQNTRAFTLFEDKTDIVFQADWEN